MRPALLWLAAALALAAGCRDAGDDKLAAARAEVCACKDSACAEAALAKVPPARAPTRAAQRTARAMLDCLARLYAAERPTTDPDAPRPADEPAAPPRAPTN